MRINFGRERERERERERIMINRMTNLKQGIDPRPCPGYDNWDNMCQDL
ncbi:hypothetical protein ACMBCM_06505 [Spiroplasma sp. K1]